MTEKWAAALLLAGLAYAFFRYHPWRIHSMSPLPPSDEQLATLGTNYFQGIQPALLYPTMYTTPQGQVIYSPVG